MNLRRSLAVAALAALPPLAAGCQGERDPERAVKEVTGVETGSEKETADVTTEQFEVRDTRTIINKSTGDVVGERTKSTDVTVQEETTVEREVAVESGETTTQTRGYVPEGLDEQP